jgi:hypothetical protein
MNLGFMTQWSKEMQKLTGKEDTDFVRKIQASFYPELYPDIKPKLHTIRTGNRWRAGMKIHFLTGNRTPNRNQFKLSTVTSVQDFKILWHKDNYQLFVDGNEIDFTEEFNLAENDGFDDFDDFLDYFNKDFQGQIIHWTNKMY